MASTYCRTKYYRGIWSHTLPSAYSSCSGRMRIATLNPTGGVLALGYFIVDNGTDRPIYFYPTSGFLQREVDWTMRCITAGVKGSIPNHLSTLQCSTQIIFCLEPLYYFLPQGHIHIQVSG